MLSAGAQRTAGTLHRDNAMHYITLLHSLAGMFPIMDVQVQIRNEWLILQQRVIVIERLHLFILLCAFYSKHQWSCDFRGKNHKSKVTLGKNCIIKINENYQLIFFMQSFCFFLNKIIIINNNKNKNIIIHNTILLLLLLTSVETKPFTNPSNSDLKNESPT